MPSSITSMFWISLAAVLAPLIAGLIPRRLIPEVVFLLGFGAILGPYGLGLAAKDEAIDMLSQLGLAMLFLLAGYEIELKELTSRAGRRALATWLACLSLAFGLVAVLHVAKVLHGEIALAIALTSTTLGTLLPILRDSGLMQTPVGIAVLRHGAFGELGPIVAIAVLLGARGPVASMLILLAFAGIAALMSLPPIRLRSETSRLMELIRLGSETTGQIPVRLTLLLLMTLIALATAFHLDIILAAFAAGFILRRALPQGNERLEIKIDGLAFGLLIPIFFVVSGMIVNPHAIVRRPDDLVAILALILVARGLPVYLVSRFRPEPSEHMEPMNNRESLAVGLFAATGLPIIVAVTAVAVRAGEMSDSNASLLVAAGATTVLLCPMLATLLVARSSEPVRQEPSPEVLP
ncbi:MAG TPA: cation:proton antiporter [Nocardioidaceae bacterium]|nr:cation:proton antiporter [Nocardioidaceae bacterium]